VQGRCHRCLDDRRASSGERTSGNRAACPRRATRDEDEHGRGPSAARDSSSRDGPGGGAKWHLTGALAAGKVTVGVWGSSGLYRWHFGRSPDSIDQGRRVRSAETMGLSMRGDRIPSLDGLRAISIGLVLFGHLLGTSGFFLPLEANKHLALGELGVRVFFVISGFLITNLLLTELAAAGRIHIGRFYLRRTFRIFPPYYVFILVLALAALARWIELAPGDLFHTLTYTSNYDATRSWNVGHTWSLSVEE
jgi:hypothetical protein